MKHSEFEFSCPLVVDKIPPSGIIQKLEANEQQRKALAKRFELAELGSLRAEFQATPTDAGQTVTVTGTIKANVVQTCVVTLEPLPSHVEATVGVVYATAAGQDPDFDPEDDEVEPIIDGIIDLGELAAQHLGIALDPYPRKPGVSFEQAQFGTSEKRENPFIKLAERAKKPKD